MSQEIARLRVPLSMPKRQVTVRGVKVDLSAEQYDTLAQLAGKPARTYLEGYVATPEYQQLSDPERVEAVREIMKDFRKSGLDALKGMYPELGGNLAPGDVKPFPQGFNATRQKEPQGASLRQAPGAEMNLTLPPGFIINKS